MLGVHGRTRVQKGQLAGHANWEMIRKIKEDLSIPVIANGSVERYEDVEECLKVSGADGVMSATGLLRNPALYSGKKIKEVLFFFISNFKHENCIKRLTALIYFLCLPSPPFLPFFFCRLTLPKNTSSLSVDTPPEIPLSKPIFTKSCK